MSATGLDRGLAEIKC